MPYYDNQLEITVLELEEAFPLFYFDVRWSGRAYILKAYRRSDRICNCGIETDNLSSAVEMFRKYLLETPAIVPLPFED